MNKKIINFGLIIILFWTSISFAQTPTGEIDASDITISVFPEIPEPNEEIEISISSFLINLDNSRITWYVNEKIFRKGVGIKKILLTSGDIGEKQTVKVSIDDFSKNLQFEKIIIIEPSSMDILWQVTDGYAPPFYKGKILPTSESMIKAVAMPNRKNKTVTEQKNLNFYWKRNFNNIPDSSGFGKQSFSFRNDYLKDLENISLTAKDQNESYTSVSSIDLKFYNPIIIFYEKKDSLGINYWKALGEGFTVGSNRNLSIVAEPFFIIPKTKNDPVLKYSWKINGTPIETPEYKSYITVRGDGGRGTSAIELEIENLSRLFQKTSRFVKVNVSEN